MLSRVADSIYWMNRYIERAENVARSIDVHLQVMLDRPSDGTERWEPLVYGTGDSLLFQERFGEATRENVVAFPTFDAGNPNSIFSCLRMGRENARSVREVISSEMWEQVNKFYLMVRSAASDGGTLDSPHDFFTDIKMASHLFSGITDATMSHGEGWHFGRIGQLMERADKTSRVLDVMYSVLFPDSTHGGGSVDDTQWSVVLKSASAFEMYRKRHGRIDPLHIAEFLILDPEFPRSMYSCVARAEESLHAISGSPMGTYQNVAEERLGALRGELASTDIEDILAGGVHDRLTSCQASLNGVGNAVFETFFTSKQVVATSSSGADAA